MTTFTPDDVARIVRAVLDRVREQRGSPHGAALHASAATLARAAALAPVHAAPAPAPAKAAPAVPSAPAGVVLPVKVVTAAALASVPAGSRVVTVRHDAVITPSARDRAREGGYDLVRAGAGSKGATAPARPFVIGTAECPADTSARTSGVVRAVPGAARLPATGLADVVAALAQHVTRDGARGLLLAGRPHAACALANRSPGIRAVTARDTATLLAALAEAGANVVVVHPRDFSGSSLDRVAVALSTSASAAPSELAPPPAAECPCGGPSKAACSCTSHAH